MNLEIITPDKTMYSGEVDLIQLPGQEGSFEILNMHAPMIALLKHGKIKVRDARKKIHYFEVNGGVVEVLGDKVLVLAE